MRAIGSRNGSSCACLLRAASSTSRRSRRFDLRMRPSMRVGGFMNRSPPDEGDFVTLTLESERYGLKGKVDCLRRHDRQLLPYEHKRGHARQTSEGPMAWPSDRLQVCAYALLIEEYAGAQVVEARIRYHADNKTVRIPIEGAARRDVVSAVARARELAGRSIDRQSWTTSDSAFAARSRRCACLKRSVWRATPVGNLSGSSRATPIARRCTSPSTGHV